MAAAAKDQTQQQGAGEAGEAGEGRAAPSGVDGYGFPLAGLTQQQAADRAACAAYEQRRRAKWAVFAERQELPTGATLKRYCRKGVPPELRGWVWWHVSGAGQAAAAAAPGHYQACLAAGSSQAAAKQIQLDLPRTFPRHPWLAGPEGQAALRDVLTAHAGHNPGVGYCQGMNFLAGLLLLAVEHDSRRCFWLLVVLLEQVLYPGTYAPNLDGCHVEMGALGALLAAKQPALAAHLAGLGCEASLLATDWFLCLFATSLPSEGAARVWDALLCERTSKVLHRVALALLGGAAPALMRLDNPGEVLRCVKAHAAGHHQRDALMAAAFTRVGGLPRRRLARLQADEARRVAAMLAARSATRASLATSIAAGRALQQQGRGREQQQQQQQGEAESGPAAGGGPGGDQQQAAQAGARPDGAAAPAAAAAAAVSVRSHAINDVFARPGTGAL